MNRKKKTAVFVAFCLILGVVIVLAYMKNPGRKYRRAVNAVKNQSYKEAQTLFEEVRSYKDSESYINYLRALKLYEEKDYENAEREFAALGNFLDSSNLKDECIKAQQGILYKKALELFEQKKYEEAAPAFEVLGGYEQSAQYASYCKGILAFSDGQYREAQNLFISIPGFLDADEWAETSDLKEKEISYSASVKAFENGNFSEALAGFQQISGYKDSTLYIHYIEGRLALDEKKYTAALTAFSSVSGFLDADALAKFSTDRQLSTQYQEAVRLFKDGDFKEATKAFSAISDYADSENYIHYMSGLTVLAEERYPEAIETFRGLEDFLDSKKYAVQAEEQYNSIQYNVAIALYEDENYVDAVKVFSRLGNYRDASSYTAYLSGILADEKQDYLSAERYYAVVPGFFDADERARKSHKAYLEQQYAFALEHMDAGDLKKARICFKNVEGYRKSAEYLVYIDGKLALSSENYLGAETCFLSLGDFLDSKALAAQCTETLKPVRYAEGLRLLKAEEYEAATEEFERIPGYQDADMYARYARILQTAYVGDYFDAIEMLEGMNGFLDSNLLKIYYKARQAEAELEYEKAGELYKEIKDFKDSNQRLARIPDLILDREFDQLTEKMTERRWWNQALTAEIREMLTREYQLANTTMPLKFMVFADQLLDSGDFEHSYTLTQIIANENNGVATRLNDIQYLYALTEMENGRPEQAEWMLSELVETDYPEAENALISCWQILEEQAREQGNTELEDEYHLKIENAKEKDEQPNDIQQTGLFTLDPAYYEFPGMTLLQELYLNTRSKMSAAVKMARMVKDFGLDFPLPKEGTNVSTGTGEESSKEEPSGEKPSQEEPSQEVEEKKTGLFNLDPAYYEIPGMMQLQEVYYKGCNNLRTAVEMAKMLKDIGVTISISDQGIENMARMDEGSLEREPNDQTSETIKENENEKKGLLNLDPAYFDIPGMNLLLDQYNGTREKILTAIKMTKMINKIGY